MKTSNNFFFTPICFNEKSSILTKTSLSLLTNDHFFVCAACTTIFNGKLKKQKKMSTKPLKNGKIYNFQTISHLILQVFFIFTTKTVFFVEFKLDTVIRFLTSSCIS